ncbi:MAG TPA: hypothetical protein DEF79_12865 [Gammaproteobacteria bacterium]|nr:hypothetical protein [Gammaproteobacteria bacterium]
MACATTNRRRKLLLSFCLCVCSGTALAAQDREQAKQDLSEVNAAIAEIRNWLQESLTRETEQEASLRITQLALLDARQALAQQTQALAAARAERLGLQQQSRGLLTDKREQEQVLRVLLKSAYIMRRDTALKRLLNAEGLTEGARQLMYMRYLSEFQLSRIKAFQSTLSALEDLDAQAKKNLSLLERQQKESVRLKNELVRAREDQSAALAALRSGIASHGNAISQLETQQAELQQLIKEIARVLEGVNSFDQVAPLTASRGLLPPPVDDRVVYEFGAIYGGGSLIRKGLSFAPNPGKPVRAVHAGRVVFADWLRGSGLLVVLDHGQGYMSLYGHNESLAVSSGDWVEASEALAQSGTNSSDRATGLYFELRHDGEPLDPAAWLR